MCFDCLAGRQAAGIMTKGLYMHVLSDSGRAFLKDSSSSIFQHLINEIFGKTDCITFFNFDSAQTSKIRLMLSQCCKKINLNPCCAWSQHEPRPLKTEATQGTSPVFLLLWHVKMATVKTSGVKSMSHECKRKDDLQLPEPIMVQVIYITYYIYSMILTMTETLETLGGKNTGRKVQKFVN